MSFFNSIGKLHVARGRVNFRESGSEADSAPASDLRLILVMSLNTWYVSGDPGNDTHIGDIAVLDEYDGANYVRKSIPNQDLSASGLDYVFSDLSPTITYTALGPGSRPAVGWILFKQRTNDADSYALAFLNSAGFPFIGQGIDVPFTFPNGLVRFV